MRPFAFLMPLHSFPILTLLTLALAAALTAGCGRETSVERGIRDQVLHRGIGIEIPDIDPHLVTGTNEFNVISALLEGLLSEDPVDLSPAPGVAERWEVSGDGLTYTFHLRPDARWSQGDPVTAGDFLASYRRMLSPALGADYAYMLYPVLNAEAFNKGLLTDFSEVGFAAPDPRTLIITLEHPVPFFLSMLNHWAWFPVHVPTIEAYGPVDRRGTPWTRPGRFVGNGPFQLKEWRLNQVIIVEKNPLYWDAATVRLREIHFHAIDSVDAEERAFRAGQLHMTEALPLVKIDSYRRERPEVLRIDPYLGTYFYRINVTLPFLSERKVRQALAMAIDREALATQVLRGGQLPAYAFTPPDTAGYTPRAKIPTDFAAARRLLAEAGHPDGSGLPAIELLFNTSENHRLIAEAIQEMWRRELGIEVRLVNQELRVYLQHRRQLDYQICRSAWIGDYVDPSTFLKMWTSDSGNNQTGWSSEAYDRLVHDAMRVQDTHKRHELFQQAEALLLEDAPIIPIYHYTHVFLLHPAVRNWHPTILDHHPYKYVYLEE